MIPEHHLHQVLYLRTQTFIHYAFMYHFLHQTVMGHQLGPGHCRSEPNLLQVTGNVNEAQNHMLGSTVIKEIINPSLAFHTTF